MLLRYFQAHAYATAALGRTVKPYNDFSGDRAARRIFVSHTATSGVYALPSRGGFGWHGFSLPTRVSSRETDGACRSLLDEPGACIINPQ